MSVEQFDVVIMGGGPGGSSAAAILAPAGLKVLVLERERFPRFHIGESLLPGIWDLWERIGAIPAIEAANFPPKQGIMFGMFNAKEDVALLTAEYPKYFLRNYAFHVERSKLDQILLDNAQSRGAEVRQEWTAKEVLFDGDRAVGVMAGPNGKEPHRIEAKMIVDATGRDCLIARRLGWRRPDPALNKIAHFTHFSGGYRRDQRDVLTDASDILPNSTATDIHAFEGGWLWYIPLSGDIVSVGAVLDAKWAGHIKGPQQRFEYAVSKCDKVRDWIAGATQTMEMHTISQISYLNDSFVGDGFVLIGDAAMFVDPIFSAGVTVATRAGVYASDCILDCFKHQDFSAERLRPYEARIKRPMLSIFRMIYNWYSILDKQEANNIIARARRIPLLRERFIVLLSGGYEKMDLERILAAAGENPEDAAHYGPATLVDKTGGRPVA